MAISGLFSVRMFSFVGAVFFVSFFFGGTFFIQSAQACVQVCISQVCPDGSGSGSCCTVSDGTELPGDPCNCVPPPLPACPPWCSPLRGMFCYGASNSCGMQGWGVTLCDGTCTPGPPPPDSDCIVCSPSMGNSCTSGANSCGMTNSGTVECDGSCDAFRPPESRCGTFAIVSSDGPGGSIAIDGVTYVSPGANQGYTITASPGHTISAVIVDGVSIGAVSNYTFNNVTSDHTIEAFFASASTINGVCSAVAETCTSGTYSNSPADTAADYRWTCLGVGSPAGTNSGTCTAPIVPLATLKICEQTGAGWFDRAGGSLTPMTLGATTTTIKAVYDTNPDCSGAASFADPWTESGPNAVSLAASGNERVVTTSALGTETITVSVGSETKYVDVTVIAPVCVVQTCADYPVDSAKVCTGSTYAISDGCSGILTCSGTRDCDYNWKEVSPY